jgi:hypothetical protein
MGYLWTNPIVTSTDSALQHNTCCCLDGVSQF